MKKPALLFFLYLFLLSCLGQISSDVYLPALPAIRNIFHTTSQLIQLSLAVFMFGYSLSHLVYGPVSDYIGRKKPLIAGIGICVVGTLLCQFAHNIALLIVGRALQGVGAGAGAALFLSILRDVYNGNLLAKISSFLGISRALLLASSPLIGGYLLHFFNWRACFIFLFFYSSICLIVSVCIFEETNTHIQPKNLHFFTITKDIQRVLSHGQFLSYAFCVMLAFGGIVAWLTTLPFLLQDVVKLTPVQFGWIAAISGLFFIVGGFINAMIVERFTLEKMLLIGLVIMLAAGMLMLLFGLTGTIDTAVIMIPVIIYIVGSSFTFSNAYAGAMHPFTEKAGTAGAVFGFLQILGGAISSSLMSAMHNYNQIPLAIILILSAIIALFIQKTANKSTLQKNSDRHTKKIRP